MSSINDQVTQDSLRPSSGKVDVAVTNRDHMHVSAGDRTRPAANGIVVNGRTAEMSLHLHD